MTEDANVFIKQLERMHHLNQLLLELYHSCCWEFRQYEVQFSVHDDVKLWDEKIKETQEKLKV